MTRNVITTMLSAGLFAFALPQALVAQTPVCAMNDLTPVEQLESDKQRFLDADFESERDLLLNTGPAPSQDITDATNQRFDLLGQTFPDPFDQCHVLVRRSDPAGFVQEIVLFTYESSPKAMWLYQQFHHMPDGFSARANFPELTLEDASNLLK